MEGSEPLWVARGRSFPLSRVFFSSGCFRPPSRVTEKFHLAVDQRLRYFLGSSRIERGVHAGRGRVESMNLWITRSYSPFRLYAFLTTPRFGLYTTDGPKKVRS